MAQYALPRHVFACTQGEHVVFLDVRNDRYFAIEAARTTGLGQLVTGWPVAAPPAPRNETALAPIISLLVEKEILTSVDRGKSTTAEPIETARGELYVDAFDERPRVPIGRLLNFGIAAIRARLLLKHRTFESVVARVRNRVGTSLAPDSGAEDSDVQELVATFAFLRPYFFAEKDACLFDALALSEYLAAYGFYPRWVFAVQARPFAAHCWLQLNGIVLNDTLDHVRRYAPIMIV